MLGRSQDGDGGSGGVGGGRLAAGSDRPLQGGVVRSSGLAYVHEGESIHPRHDAQAQIDLLASDLGADIHVTLPVVVHISTADDDERRASEIADMALRRLRHALESQRLD